MLPAIEMITAYPSTDSSLVSAFAAAAFLKYGHGTPSDHRVLWANFLKSDIIGARAADYRPPVVGLRAYDPRGVTRYNTRSFAKLKEAKLLESLTTLSKIDPGEFNQEHQK
jgi:hypothetical protein